MPEYTALIVIAHGSRNDSANEDTRQLAAELKRGGPFPAVAAFLEIAEPDIDTASSQCIATGATRLILPPHFLGARVHVERDLAEARRRLAERIQAVDVRLAEPLGRHPSLVDLLAEQARQVMENESVTKQNE